MIDLSSIEAEDLLERLDLQNVHPVRGGDEVKFDCYGGEHADGGASYMNAETTAWMCHGCKRKGNAITLVMEVQNVGRSEAERLLREWYGIEFDEPMGGSMVAELEARLRQVEDVPPPPPPPASWLAGVSVGWDDIDESWAQYILERGFTAETLESWDVGYDYFSDRVTIPVFNVDGELVGIKGRAYMDHQVPKYLVLGDRPGMPPRYGFMPYEAAAVVFGLHRRRDVRTVVLCEGEFNAMALSQIGVARPVATGMSYMSNRHAELLVREADEVVVYYDFGAAGETGAALAAKLLDPHVRVRLVRPTDEADPADLVCQGSGQIALDLIADAKSSLQLPIASVSV